MNGDGPVRVAVIGSGCASVAAAFELTRPEHGGRYQVTIYQTGWRMGGKGASGRGPAGRIEEHGLHVWLGFYENAFAMIKRAYADLDRPAGAPLRTWDASTSTLSKATSRRPASRSGISTPVPLYGTKSMSMPAMRFRCSPARRCSDVTVDPE